MYDVITIGSATVDFFFKSPEFHLRPTGEGMLLCEAYGGKIDINHFEMQSGGAGTNCAVGFARMGFTTAAVVEIGKDVLAQVIWDDLKREGVQTEFVVSEKGEHTALSALLISEEGGRSALTYRGASSQLEARDVPWEALRQTRWIHLSNVAGDLELLVQLFQHIKLTKVGLSWNPGKNELELLATKKLQLESICCDILVVNKEEWKVVENVQDQLLPRIPIIIVTDGKNGGEVYFRGAYQLSYQAQPVQVVQETGAGDAFVVGFVSAYLFGKQLAECCEWGVKNAAGVVQQMGAKIGLLRRKEVERAKARDLG